MDSIDPHAKLRNAVTHISAGNAAMLRPLVGLEHADKLLETAETEIHEVRTYIHDLKLERLAGE